jgi:hypothetical protein
MVKSDAIAVLQRDALALSQFDIGETDVVNIELPGRTVGQPKIAVDDDIPAARQVLKNILSE